MTGRLRASRFGAQVCNSEAASLNDHTCHSLRLDFEPMRKMHWIGEEVEKVETTLDELGSLLPVFDRYGLGRTRV